MRILVTTDFSPTSVEACRIACCLARATHGTLVVAHVLDSQNPEAASEARAAAQRRLDGLRAQLDPSGHFVHAEVLQGRRDAVIATAMRAHGTQLMVVPDEGGERRHAADLRDELGCPLLVLGPVTHGLRAALAGERRLRVLAAVDSTPQSDAAIAWIDELRSLLACDVLFLHARAPGGADDARGFEERLAKRAANFPGVGSTRIASVPVRETMGDTVVDTAADIDADLIVVGSHHRHGWERLEHLSVSEALLEQCNRPVVCVSQANSRAWVQATAS